MRVWRSTVNQLLFVFLTILCAANSTSVFAEAILDIVPASLIVNLSPTGVASISYSVTNDTTQPINQLTIDPNYQSSGNESGISLQNNNCALVTLSPKASCTFQILLNGKGQPSSFFLRPRVCGYDGAVCSVPTENNKVQVVLTAIPAPLASGNYGASITYPMLAASSNGGSADSWSYVIDSANALPEGFSGDGSFNSTSCVNAVCVAVGKYYSNTGSYFSYPMIALSTNGGLDNSWEYVIDESTGDATLPTDYNGSGVFYSVSCSENICLAGGQYNASDTTYPMLALSTKSGARGSWTYVVDKANALPQTQTSEGIFNTVSCSGNICSAGGQYVHTNASSVDEIYPMLVVSTNANEGDTSTWSYVVYNDTNQMTLPSAYDGEGNFNSVSCSGSICIAGGQYSLNNTPYPMLIMNTDVDGTGSWTYVVDSGTGLPDQNTDNGFFKGTSCSGDFCLAGGGYSSGGSNYPMLAFINTNQSVQYVISSEGPLPTGGGSDGVFQSVSCSGEICAAAGGYISNSLDYPMLAVSTQSGASSTWNYVVDSTADTLPQDFENGGSFFGVTCTGLLCIADGYYASTNTPNYYPMLITSTNVTQSNSWNYALDGTNGPLPTNFDNLGNYGLFCGSIASEICNN